MTDKQRSISNNAKKTARYIIVSYVIIKQLIYVFAIEGTYWIPRGIAGILMILAVFATTYSKTLTNRQMSILTPFTFALIEIVLCASMGGDRMLYYFMIGCSLMSLLFLDASGLLIFMVLSGGCTITASLIINSSLLGEAYTLLDDFYGMIGLLLINSLIFSICKYSVGSFRESQRTSDAFNVVLNTTPNHLLVVNENARVEYISKSFADWLGISQAQYAKDRPVLDLLLTDEMDMLFQEVMESNDYVEKTIELMIDDKKRWYSLRSSLMKKAGKNTGIARIYELNDITLVMEAKNEAEAATKAKSSFLANMSHEIRTPMNAIMGLIELIMLKPLNPEQLNHAVAIKGASMSLLKIINDILDFSKLDAEKMEIINKPFDFSSLINDTVNIINIKTQSTDIAFTTYISKDIPPKLNSDELRLKQVLLNLLNNAVKFTKEGCVSLRVTSEIIEGNRIKINFAIKDTGVGIKKEEIGKLFGVFQQVDTHKNRSIEGTGLGLVISRRLVELMGGSISVDSVYGEGSVFSFYIICQGEPLEQTVLLSEPEKYSVIVLEPNHFHADAMREAFADLGVKNYICGELAEFKRRLVGGEFTHVFYDKQAEDIVKASPGNFNSVLIKNIGEMSSLLKNTINRPVITTVIARLLSGRHSFGTADGQSTETASTDEIRLGAFRTSGVKILLVDDNPVNLTVAEGMLRQYGMDVATASGGLESIDKVQSEKFDIVFMDHMMPDMDGIEATEAIRALGGLFSEIPIIALSANAITGVEDLFLEAGMNDSLSKPIVVKNLHHILLKYLPREKVEIIC